MNKYELHMGDCLDVMKSIPDGSVDMILCDLPYGTTACAWDSALPLCQLWSEYMRVAKPHSAIVLTASQPFTTTLIASNMPMFRYSWVWEKDQGVNFLSAKRQPLKAHEDVVVFYKDLAEQRGAAPEYLPLREYFQSEREKTGISSKQMRDLLGNHMAGHYFTNGVQFCIPSEENYLKLQSTGAFMRPYHDIKSEYEELGASIRSVTYNPQMTTGKPYISGRGDSGAVTGNVTKVQTVNEGTRYPRSIQFFKRETGLHPTQKPVPLMEYLIRTYTNEGDTVMDNCMGSGTTGVACMNTGRRFIGIEMDSGYFQTAQDRIMAAAATAAKQPSAND